MRPLSALSAALCAALGLAAASAARAESPIVIDGLEGELREAILDLLPDRDRPTTLFEAERIAEEAAARALAWLRSEGYYGAEVTPEASDDPASARLRIAPGPRFRFAAPTLAFEGAPPTLAAADAARHALAPVSEGAPARAQHVLDAQAGVLAALQLAGYADAEAGERRVIVDHAAAQVATEFRFTAGPATRLGAVTVAPAGAFRASFVDSLRSWEIGALYAPQSLTRLRRDIVATGAVSRAATELGPADANGVREVVLNVELARRNAYELGLGYSTTEGFGLEAEWTRRNLSGRADALTFAATLGEVRQSLSAELTRPHAAGLGHTVLLGIAAERDAPVAYTREGLALYASVDASTRLRVSRSYGARLSADSYHDLAGGVRNALVLSGFADLRHDTTEFSLDPHDGSIVELRFEPSLSTGDETLGFIRAIAEGRAYESFGADNRLTLAARLRAGWLEAIAGSADAVPPDRRFYAGGGGSVRGYDYNSIYPTARDLAGLAPGGQGVLDGSLEARWRFGDKLGAALFLDGGNAFDDWREASDLRWGAGLGARYDLGFAPLRIDVAFPLDKRETSADYALYISVGQAF